MGANNHDRLVGPFGEHLCSGGHRDLPVAVVARRPLRMRHLTGMAGYVAGDYRALPFRFDPQR